MKTKQQLKDQYASSLGYGTWSTAIKCLALFDATEDSIKAIDKFIDGYQELCCDEVGKASLDKAQYPKDEHGNDLEFGTMYSDSNGREYTLTSTITSPDNIVKL